MRVSVKDIAQIQIGYQVKEGLRPSSDGTHFVIQVKDIDENADHHLVTQGLDRITPARDPNPYIVSNGDVLFLSRGRRNYATLAIDLPKTPPTIALYYFFILRTDPTLVNPAFLTWVINEEEAQAYIESVANGTAMPFVTKQSFSSLEFDLPPLEEQSEIGRLYQLMSHEKQLHRRIEATRSKLIHTACRMIYKNRHEIER